MRLKSPLTTTSLTILLLLVPAVALILGVVGVMAWTGVAFLWGILLLFALILGYAQVLAWVGMTGRLDESTKRTLWDWMQMLIVPAVLAFGALWLATAQEERQRQEEARREARQQELADERERAAQRIEERRAQDAMLSAYLDQMSTLLLDKDMQQSEPGAPERLVAGARTITVVRTLDPERKRAVLRFVYEAGLIREEDPIMDLASANLSKADLDHALLEEADLSDLHMPGADLEGADLSGTDLSGTDLGGATLTGADLTGADLTGANMSGTNVSGANLRGAEITQEQLDTCGVLAMATMPDGSKHSHGGRRA